MTGRALTAAVGLVASVALSVVAWVYYDTLFVFLLVPFVPLLARRRRSRVQECPECGFRTRDDDYEFCPRDGSELE